MLSNVLYLITWVPLVTLNMTELQIVFSLAQTLPWKAIESLDKCKHTSLNSTVVSKSNRVNPNSRHTRVIKFAHASLIIGADSDAVSGSIYQTTDAYCAEQCQSAGFTVNHFR